MSSSHHENTPHAGFLFWIEVRRADAVSGLLESTLFRRHFVLKVQPIARPIAKSVINTEVHPTVEV